MKKRTGFTNEQIHCPHCHLLLERVDHSPFLDNYWLYCNRCPIRVEVSSYDPVLEQVQNQVRQATGTDRGERYYGALMRAVEARLNPCRCGGCNLTHIVALARIW